MKHPIKTPPALWHRLQRDPGLLHVTVYDHAQQHVSRWIKDRYVRETLTREVARRAMDDVNRIADEIQRIEPSGGYPPGAAAAAFARLLEALDGAVQRGVDPAFLALCRSDDQFLWSATLSMTGSMIRRRYKVYRYEDGSTEADLVDRARGEVMSRLEGGRKVLLGWRGSAEPPEEVSSSAGSSDSFWAFLRTSIRNCITDLQRTKLWSQSFWAGAVELDAPISAETGRLHELPAPRTFTDALRWLTRQRKTAQIRRVLDVIYLVAESRPPDERHTILHWLEWIADDSDDEPRTQAALAERLGKPSGTVNAHVFRFRKRLLEMLGDEARALLRTSSASGETQP